MWIFAAFLTIPLVEIALFITVGGWIGLWPTLLIVVLTAIAGTILVRSQGARALADLRTSLNTLNNPAEPLANGAMILFAGALLVTPGFFTDAIGFALLVPGIRAAVFNFLRSRVEVSQFEMGPGPVGARSPSEDGIIDGEWEEVPSKRPTHKPSGWTQH
jgi:UPF0716 protein FxsA